MKTLHRLLVLSVLCVALAPVERAADTSPRPPNQRLPLEVFLSAGDSWWFGTWLPVDSAGSIGETVQMWSDVMNIKRIYWRGEQEEMMVDYGLIRPQNLVYHEFLTVWEKYLMKKLGLNQILVNDAHKKGMEVYLWAPLFDFCGPADSGGCKEYPYYAQLNLTLQHPEWMPVDRYGVRLQNGPIEFAYPEARKALIDIYLHYIDRDHLDGVTFFTYCENYGLRFEDEFGYSQPVVDEFKRRYGVDIRTQEFDRVAWRYLRGEYVTQFLRELGTALHARGKKLGVRLNPREPNYPDRFNVPLYFLTAGRIYLDWEKWVREGIVDELNVSGSAPDELQERTLDNVLQASKGTGLGVSVLSSNPYSPRLARFTARNVKVMLFATDDASYLKLIYPAQPASALTGADPYATIRYLAQIAEGEATAKLEDILPLTKHPRLLVRRQALRALGKLGDPRAVPALEEALNDPERSVRSSAVFALQHVHGPHSVEKMIASVRSVREFQVFEAVSSALVAIDRPYLPEIIRLAGDPDVLMRRMAIYVLGRRGDPEGLPAIIAALKDPDLYVRFRAAHGLQSYRTRPEAIAALTRALDDADVVVQDRAAVSLPIALVPGSTVKPRLGLESSISILDTPTGPLRTIALSAEQRGALDALERKFRQFGDGSARSDLDWGFRPVGNAMLAFGAEGGRRLQGMIDQKRDKQLARLAWQVLNIRQAMEKFCVVPGAPEADAQIYASYPGEKLNTEEAPSPLKYDPTAKGD